MSDIKKMFERWRRFLDGDLIGEAISDKAIGMEATSAKTFKDLLVKSPESARLAIELIDSAIESWNVLLTKDISSEEYRSNAKFSLGKPDAVTEDRKIEACISELEEIKNEILIEYFPGEAKTQ